MRDRPLLFGSDQRGEAGVKDAPRFALMRPPSEKYHSANVAGKLFSEVRVYPVHRFWVPRHRPENRRGRISAGLVSRSLSTLFAAVAASHPYLIMAMRIASALGRSLSPPRSASFGSLRGRGVMIRSSAPPFVNVASVLYARQGRKYLCD